MREPTLRVGDLVRPYIADFDLRPAGKQSLQRIAWQPVVSWPGLARPPTIFLVASSQVVGTRPEPVLGRLTRGPAMTHGAAMQPQLIGLFPRKPLDNVASTQHAVGGEVEQRAIS